MKKPRWRKTTWIILAWNVLMVVWIATAVASNNDACKAETTYRSACQAGANAGTGIAVGFIVIVAIASDVVLGIIWLATNSRYRKCPSCGYRVRNGATSCPTCEHDFGIVRVRTEPPSSVAQWRADVAELQPDTRPQ